MNQKVRRKFKETEIGLIPEDWKVTKIKEIIAKQKYSITMGPFGSNITKNNFISSGVPIIRGSNLTDYKFNSDEFVYLTEEKADQLISSNAFPKDIVITHRGTLGQVGIIPENGKYQRYVISQSQMKFTCNENIVNSYFIFYYLKSPKGQFSLLKNTSQTGVPAIAQPLASLKEIPVPVPPKKEQTAIVEMISDMQDKIELNRQMNKTLEAIGQAIFKRWFIDFEFPNMEGKPYKSSGGEMVDSELGEIPKGWKVGKLGELIEINMGQSPDSKYYNDNEEGMPFYQGIKDFGFIFPSLNTYCSAPKKISREGEILFSVRAPVGEVNIAYQKCCIGRGVAALKMKNKQNFFLFYLLLNSKDAIKQIYESEGTVFGCINKKGIDDFQNTIPSNVLIEKFNSLVCPSFKMMLSNFIENSKLTNIRDSLLPRLMSGKIRVPVEVS